MDLFKASQQWSKRPDDERIESGPQGDVLGPMIKACAEYRESAVQSTVTVSDLRVEADEVIDELFARLDLGRRVLEEAYQVAEHTPRYGSPRSPWGMVSGLTQLSQRTTYTDQRVTMDRAAGKILTMAF